MKTILSHPPAYYGVRTIKLRSRKWVLMLMITGINLCLFDTVMGQGEGNHFNTVVKHQGRANLATGASYNTFVGWGAGAYGSNVGSNNTFLGYYSGNKNSSGNSNTFLGYSAGRENTIGNYNTYLGQSSGRDNTTGINNTFLGYNSGSDNTTGNHNTYLGNVAGRYNIIGTNNTFLGYGAGYTNTGAYNTHLGTLSGRNSDGSNNVFIGYQAGYEEDGSNKLYIENTNATAPLIYGEFNNDFVTINGKLGVGIGNNVPTQELEVRGGIFAEGHLALYSHSGINTSGISYIQARDYSYSTSIAMQIRTQNNGSVVEAIKITPDGKVGIGVTDPGTEERFVIHTGGERNNVISIRPDANVGMELRSGSHNGTPYIDFSNDNDSDFDMRMILVDDNAMQIAGGDVGIGTNDPRGRLHVVSTNQDPNGTIFTLGPLNASNLRMGYHADYTWIQSHNGSPLHINKIGNNTILNLNNGYVGIGTENPSAKFHVKGDTKVDGKITTKEVEITPDGWADFVFENNYNLRPLEEVEAHILANKHLPDVPSAQEVLDNGINLGEMNTTLLQKIEELTLYMIDLKKRNNKLEAKQRALELELDKLK